MKLMIVLFLNLLLPIVVDAHGIKFEISSRSMSAALEKFSLEETPATLKNYLGIKQWMEGNEVRIKVYLSEEPKEIRYACHEMHGAGGNDVYHCEKVNSR